MIDRPPASTQPENEPIPKPTRFEESVALISLIAAVLSLFLFAWIAENVSRERTKDFDLRVRNEVHRYASPDMTRAMIAISFLGGDGLVVAAILSLILFLRLRRRRAAVWLVVTLAGATVLDLALKYAFHRTRPAPFFGPLPRTFSFPSGHSLFSFCFYGVLAGLIAARVRSLWLRVVIWMFAAALVFAIGLSRIYLGVHYPSDVIAGYLTASLWVATMVFLDRWRKRKRMNRGSLAASVAILAAVGHPFVSAQTEVASPPAVIHPCRDPHLGWGGNVNGNGLGETFRFSESCTSAASPARGEANAVVSLGILAPARGRPGPVRGQALCPAAAERVRTSRSATSQSSLSLPGDEPRSR